MKKAIITGIGGQDSSILAEFLLKKRYKVFGTYRPVDNLNNIKDISNKITLLQADLLDNTSIVSMVREADPDEIYNLAAMSFVAQSWGDPSLISNINGLGVTRILNAIKNYNPAIRFYQASSSEMFGKVKETPQNEETPFNPQSPYAVSKTYGYYITRCFRKSYDLHATNGILFNHCSERRPEIFVTRKITSAVAKIKLGLQEKLYLGNLDAKRDIGHSKDYVESMYLMLQQDKPGDYVIGSGETHSIKEMLEVVFSHVGLDWKKYVEVDKRFYRPADVQTLCADSSKARNVLGWKPKITWKDLLIGMLENDLKNNKI